MKQQLMAIKDVGARYAEVVKSSWSRRNEMAAVQRTTDELAFQPAVIELVDTPVSPIPRRTMQWIVALFLVSITWAWFGQLDIVAVAQGKVVSDARTKVIQALETSVVRNINVADGQFVKRGQLLVVLDAVGVRSDQAKASDSLLAARLNVERTVALAASYENERAPVVDPVDGASQAQIEASQSLASSEYETYRKKVDALRANVAQKRFELHTLQQSIPLTRDYAKIAADRVSDYKRLLAKNYVSRQEYLMREQDRITSERDVELQQNRVAELAEAVRVAQGDLTSAINSARRELLDTERQLREQITQASAEFSRAGDRGSSMKLFAPVDGTVQQLAVHTVGGVVTPAEPLMSVAPSGGAVEVEASVLNEDIGFIREGQRVVAKLRTFPYTRYGSISGRIISISQDAVQDDKLGLVFPIHVLLDRKTMLIDGRNVEILPGMALSVEIDTGKRTVLSYFLEPLQAGVTSALRER